MQGVCPGAVEPCHVTSWVASDINTQQHNPNKERI